MTAREAVVLLCGLVIAFAGLTIAVKQYALIWWAGCLIAAVSAAIIVTISRNGNERFIPPAVLIVAGVGVLMVVVGFIAGARGITLRL